MFAFPCARAVGISDSPLSASRRDHRARCAYVLAEGTGNVRWLTWVSGRSRRARRAAAAPALAAARRLAVADVRRRDACSRWACCTALAGAGRDDRAGSAALLAAGLPEPHRRSSSLGGLGGSLLRRRRPRPAEGRGRRLRGHGGARRSSRAGLVVAGIVHRPDDRGSRRRRSRSSRWPCAAGSRCNGDRLRARARRRAPTACASTRTSTAPACRAATPSAGCASIVDTSQSPPRVKRDSSRESNALFNPRGAFR